MADLRDEFGNPIQLTDEHGNPVALTDEYGNPVHITGLATSMPLTLATVPLAETGGLPSTSSLDEALKAETGEHGKIGGDEGEQTNQRRNDGGEIKRSSSSSSSSEDDGQGGRRRKKKGLTQKIKEKLTGGKHKDEHGHSVNVSTTATTPVAEQHHEHEKKSVMEKIKEKLPGHHSHTKML